MTTEKGAVFSPDRSYRYRLWRIWDASRPIALFVGLNPSTADETCDDPTVAKCVSYARAWDYGGMYMGNLFALMSTDRSALQRHSDPIGAENDPHLLALSESAAIVIAAWGNEGAYLGRSEAIRKLLPNLHYLKLNKTGEPAHPLYLAGTLKPMPWDGGHA